MKNKKEYDRIWYQKNKNRIKEKKRLSGKKSRDKKRKYVIEVLKESDCADCGIKDWRVLEFDHKIPSEKNFNIADAPNKSFLKIKEEISKCDIVCANCHNIRTIIQRDYYNI